MEKTETYLRPKVGEPVDAFLRELGELSRKHKIGLTGLPVLFVMEPVDMALEYTANEDSIVSFG